MESIFKQFDKNKDFRLIIFVLVGIFINETGFAQTNWNRKGVKASLLAKTNMILITTCVYCFSEIRNPADGYLEECKFEASVDNKHYFKLLKIQTPRQNKDIFTDIIFKNKLKRALIIFSNEYSAQRAGLVWPDHLSKLITVKVPNLENMSAVVFKWSLGNEFRGVRYIRISGKWKVIGRPAERFRKVVYDLTIPDENVLKSNAPDIIMEKAEKDTVNIFKDSEAIVIKGADLGANIKVYSTSGLEIKSVIPDNDLVKIKLPANQIYIVHVGKSRFKVAL